MKIILQNIILKLKQKDVLLFLFFLAVGIGVRLLSFGNVPGGLNQDEAFAGYEAYSLLHYGMDSAGYSNPCYFVSWGSGMNVLESYLAIPFVKLFGLTVVSIRLPQVLVGCISLPVFYLLLKELLNKKAAFIGLGFLAICPWHIMLSRWGLESNLAPGFLLFGLYFLVKGLKDNRFLMVSAAMYGTSLYAYATTWAVVPLTLLAVGLYLFLRGHKLSFKWTSISILILFVMALPLILFFFVNQGVIPEIKTAFFSAPKLLHMRGSEISLKNLLSPEEYEKVFGLLFTQEDGLIWNSAKEFGLFYGWTLPFIFVGGAHLFTVAWKKLRTNTFSPEFIVCLGLFSAFLICVMISGLNINKANILHYYVLLLLVVGIERVFYLLQNKILLKQAITAGLAVSFIWFTSFYFGEYNTSISTAFKSGLGEAVAFAKTVETDGICVDPSIYHSQILFYDQTSPEEYIQTVEYKNYPSAYLQASKFGEYTFYINYSSPEESKTYILPKDNADAFSGYGYRVVEFGQYSVVYME